MKKKTCYTTSADMIKKRAGILMTVYLLQAYVAIRVYHWNISGSESAYFNKKLHGLKFGRMLLHFSTR